MPHRSLVSRFLLAGVAVLGTLAVVAWVVRAAMGPPKFDAPPGDKALQATGTPRIVALSPAVAVTLRDLGLADRIVGRHGYDLALDPAVPVCGDQLGIDYEALIRVRPTHILTEWGAREIPARLKELAAANNWSLRDYTQLKLDDVIDNTVKLGLEFAGKDAAALGGDAHAEAPPAALGSLVNRMQAAWRKPHKPLTAGRILLLESIDPPAAVGPGSFHQDILQRIGGTPAITSGKAYMTLDLEDILRLAPDGIVLLAPRPPRTPEGPPASTRDLIKRLGRIGTLDIPAIRNSRVALIDDPCCLLPGSSLLIYSEQLEAVLAAWSSPR